MTLRVFLKSLVPQFPYQIQMSEITNTLHISFKKKQGREREECKISEINGNWYLSAMY